MLATHTIDPEDLFTISAGGFSATVDAFARDDRTEGSGSSRWWAPRPRSRRSGHRC